MTDRLAWLPPAAVGAAAAAAAEMALGLLLYSRGGLVGALTLVLCVETGALGLGLWSAPRNDGPPWPAVRRAWILLLLAHVAGAALAVGWEVVGGLGGSWVGRALGLAGLAALPLYATGTVLGAIADGDPAASTGAPAAIGAAAGFALVGFGRSALRIAAFPYVAAVVAVAAGALVHGRMLEARARTWTASHPIP